MGSLLNDVRLACRALARRPGFAVVAVLTLGLGIGANTAVFSVVRGVVLRPLPFPDDDQLVSLWYRSQGRRTGSLSQPELADLSTKVASLESVAGMVGRRIHLGRSDEPRLVRVVDATPELLPLLGVAPAAGRFYSAAESIPDVPPVVVISDALRQRLFVGQSDVIGHEVILGGAVHTVVGVMPPGFAFPSPDIEAYRPFPIDPANLDQRNNHYLWTVGRLRKGVTVEAARAEIAGYGRWAAEQYPEYYSGFDIAIDATSLRETLVGSARTPLFLVLGAVSLVLLIACANVAGLLLARGEERRREMAVRLALGASRRHLARHLLVESLVLGSVGTVVALLIAWVSLPALLALAADALPRIGVVTIDAPVLVFTVAVGLLASAASSLVPLLRVWGRELRGDLENGIRDVSAGRGGVSLRRVLVAGQVALAVVLVASASLLTRTILALYASDVGFRTDGTVAVRMALPPHVYDTPEAIIAFTRELEGSARALAGVEAAGVVDSMPLWQGITNNLSLQVEGRVVENVGEAPTALVKKMSPGALAALGMRLQSGRLFTPDDVASGRYVAVVNEAFVRTVLAGDDPATTRVRMFSRGQEWMDIVGVIQNFGRAGNDADAFPQILVPFELARASAYRVPTDFFLLIHGAGSTTAVASAARGLVREVGPAVAIREIETLERIKRASLGDRSLLATLVAVAAALALSLAVVGLYGAVALWVGQRRREIGLRMALGAGRSEVWWLVVIQAARPVLVGLVLGLVAVVPLAHIMRALLHGVSPVDPASLVVVVGALGAGALVAAFVPARRATHVDPATTLRCE